MLSILRRALAIGKTLATGHVARDSDPDAPFEGASTRQRTRSRTTSLKAMATCRRQSLLVEVTVTNSPHALTAVALIQHKDPHAVPVFVATHTAIEDNGLASTNSLETTGIQDTCFAYKCDASERVNGAAKTATAGEAAVRVQVWRDENDAHEEILQNLAASENAAIMKQSIVSDYLAALYNEPGAIVWESAVPDVPHIVFTPADESWDDFAGRCSNQPNQQWVGPYIHVPLATPAFSPFGPTDPSSEFVPPNPVFSRSRFAAFVSISSSHASHQALFAQRHAYKAVAYLACHSGSSLRAYYDSPIVHAKLDKLYLFAWTDPAAPFLEIWRTCFMVSVYESENPFRGVPHIVITGTLPNAPWDTEPALVPEQDERFLTVSTCYMQVAEEEEDTDDKWYCGDDEEEEVPCVVHWSESEEESDDARTPSPPSWPLRTFPTSTGRRASTLDDVFEEEDEDVGEVPSVLEARFRRPWLQDDDGPPVTGSLSSRFNFSTTLPGIGERTLEDAYRPLAADYKPLWTGNAMLPISPGADADDSGDDQSQYMDALDQAQDSEAESHYVDAEQPEETDGDQYQSEDDYRYHAHHIPRPSCDIFLNDEDGDPPQLPRGKANIPAGKLDWFDLLDDSDLGSLEWPAPRTNNDT